MRFRGLLTLAAGLILVASQVAPAQVSDAALKDRVAQLVERLESPKVEIKGAAEKSLIDLGPKILPLLPSTGEKTKADVRERIERVKKALQEKDEQTNLGASKVTLKAQAMRLTEVIKALQGQSGNIINDLRESNGMEATNPALDLDIVDKPFYEALDVVAEKAGVTYTAFTGDGTLGLMAGAGEPAPDAPKMARPLVVYSGPFRIQFKQLAIVRDFAMATGRADAQFEVMWEPRLRPMLLSVKNQELKVTDDQGKAVAPEVKAEANETALSAGNCAAEMNLALAAPERGAKTFSSFKVKGDVTVPSGMKAFKFANLNKANDVQKQGDISVTLESLEVEEQIWKFSLAVAYPEGGPAFESYRQGLLNNRLWLQKPDGSRFEHNGGFSNTGSDEGKVSFEYMFVDAPGKPADHMLVYETPAKVVPIVLEFEFKDVPLP